MDNGKHILLISYVFPPYPGIGGRRWAKFVKNLAKMGFTVHVIHAKNPFSEISLWTKDVQDNRIRTYPLKSFYPKVLLTVPQTFFQKLNYRISLLITKVFSKGTPYDRGIFWNSSALKLSGELIKRFGIRNVVVSCAPFSSGYRALELKTRFNRLNLMIDFRDPWTWGPGYGFSSLAGKRLAFESRMLNNTIEKSDKIFVPVDIMRTVLSERFPMFQSKVVVLPHAFDKDEVTVRQTANDRMGMDLIFYGSLYEELGEYFEEIIKAMLIPGRPIYLHIYSDSVRYIELFKKNGLLNKRVYYNEPLPASELFKKITSADYVLMIHPDRGVDNISTKFYEIIYSRTPIIYISKPGLTSNFVSENKVGYFFQRGEIAEGLSNLKNGLKPYDYNSSYEVEKYSFEKVTETLVNDYFND